MAVYDRVMIAVSGRRGVDSSSPAAGSDRLAALNGEFRLGQTSGFLIPTAGKIRRMLAGDTFLGGEILSASAANQQTGTQDQFGACIDDAITRVSWSLSGASDANEQVDIYWHNGGGTYSLLVSGLTPSAGYYDHVHGGEYDVAANSNEFSYRVHLRFQGSLAESTGSPKTGTLERQLAACFQS